MSAGTMDPEVQQRPLDGVRILELGMVFVLPLAITPLAALGADVIKVEAGARPDQVRWGPPPDNRPRPDGYNHGANFQMLNRNKRGITIDLTRPAGRELLLRLVSVCDVVAENFTPRVLRNLGLTYETLAAVNPGIILLSSTGFGQTGPWQNYRAYGPNTESVDGLMELTGYPDGPPVRGGAGGLGVAFTDVAGAYFGTYGILAALEYRERTGLGQWLDLSHYEAGVATIPEAVLDFELNGRVQGRVANRHPWRAPQGVYPCAGLGADPPGAVTAPLGSSPEPEQASSAVADDRWIAISVATDAQFRSLCGVLGLQALTVDPSFGTSLARRRNHELLDRLIADATRGCFALELEHALQAAGVEASAVSTPRDVWLDPQLHHRRFFEQVPPSAAAPEIGPRPHLRAAWRMSRTPVTTRTRAPEFGQHTGEVLGQLLGFGAPQLAALEQDGVLAREPRTGVLARPGAMDLQAMVRTGRMREADPDYAATLERRFTPAPE
jgi:crotonobetainyl-CoA:carnitine CoA-transferase CaiB-like acyl-CoA transferase